MRSVTSLTSYSVLGDLSMILSSIGDSRPSRNSLTNASHCLRFSSFQVAVWCRTRNVESVPFANKYIVSLVVRSNVCFEILHYVRTPCMGRVRPYYGRYSQWGLRVSALCYYRHANNFNLITYRRGRQHTKQCGNRQYVLFNQLAKVVCGNRIPYVRHRNGGSLTLERSL